MNKFEEILRDEKAKIVFFTGAGISTSSGIPDFRGPSGIWTIEKSKNKLEMASKDFAEAVPSRTHLILLSFLRWRSCFIVSQNIDGLHIRSGVPPEKLIEIHGNIFVETCSKCKQKYYRHFEIQTIGLKSTGRQCPQCNGELVDFLLDWDTPLIDEDLVKAENIMKGADIVICLGTSLRVSPAGELPLLCKKYNTKGKLVLVNLQKTPHDEAFDLKINANVDCVMMDITARMNYPGSEFYYFQPKIQFRVDIQKSQDLKNEELLQLIPLGMFDIRNYFKGSKVIEDEILQSCSIQLFFVSKFCIEEQIVIVELNPKEWDQVKSGKKLEKECEVSLVIIEYDVVSSLESFQNIHTNVL